MELKECRQSHKEFCQSRDIFGVANVCACVCEAQKGWCRGSSHFFFGAETRRSRVEAPKKLTAAETPALLC